MKKPIILEEGVTKCIRHISPDMIVGQHFIYNILYSYKKVERFSSIMYEVTGENKKIQEMTPPIFKSFFKIEESL